MTGQVPVPALPVFTPLAFARGPVLRNRLVLAPLTNCQSHADGTLSEDEFRWLRLRAEGGFGLVMTCGAHVQPQGQSFPGQLGIFADRHVEGLSRLAAAIRGAGSVGLVQLFHAGIRSPAALIGGVPVGPSADEASGARGLEAREVEQLIADFAAAAHRAERAGFDGVELHAAHGYLLCQFLSPDANRRTDQYGGSPGNRARLLLEVIEAIRERCRPEFIVGVRLSPERFGMRLPEIRELAQRLMREAAVDFIDLSLWDIFKEPEDEALRGRSLLSYFSELERGPVRLGAAGRITTGEDAARGLAAGLDFVVVGRAAILHHDLPARLAADPAFRPVEPPVPVEYLARQGVGPAFVGYLRERFGMVRD